MLLGSISQPYTKINCRQIKQLNMKNKALLFLEYKYERVIHVRLVENYFYANTYIHTHKKMTLVK